MYFVPGSETFYYLFILFFFLNSSLNKAGNVNMTIKIQFCI